MNEPTSMAERLFGNPPAPVEPPPATGPGPFRVDPPQPVPEPDIGRRLFGETMFAEELPDGVIPSFDAQAGREVAQDIGATGDDVSQFVALARQSAPTAEQSAEWRTAAEQVVKEREFTADDIDLARRFVARDKRLFAALDRGLGNHPRMVERVVYLARSARNAGKFR